MKSNYSPRPLWFWNDTPTPQGIQNIMENCVSHDHYAGFGILTYSACKLKYLDEEYLKLYEIALQEAEKINIKMCIYDEWWFPSGSAGGILKEKYPNACAKRLDLVKFESSTRNFNIDLPDCNKIMAVVAMKNNIFIDVEKYISNNKLSWLAPDDGFVVLYFILNNTDIGRVDYLNPLAVEKFIECTHEVYYKYFSKYFGNVIDSFFYDEPQFYSVKGRAWTENFNELFIEKYGFSPTLYYPALFYDIGPETAQAKYMMFSLRNELYSKGFPKVIQDWCTRHNVSLTGHVDQEEVANPCGITGDLMLSFKYQDIPGVDEIFKEERGTCAYKVVSSSAVNWNKKLVMCECFGAIEDITEEGMYRESYDLFTKGVNMLVPHAVWYNSCEDKIKFKPELSYRHEYYGKFLNKFNDFCALIQEKLQESFSVNSIAVLYPIENLTYLYSFSWDGDPVMGGPTNINNDYLDVGQFLIRNCNCDFTFIHPEILQNNCLIENGILSIIDSIHYQNYKCLIIPGMTAISIKTLNIIKNFVKSGGYVISTSEFPSIPIEAYKESELYNIAKDLFGDSILKNEVIINAYGKGKCIFIPQSKRHFFVNCIDELNLDTKVKNHVYGLQYIHKRNSENDVWYFASIKENANTKIELDGIYSLKAVDPKSKNNVPLCASYTTNSTIFDLKLKKEDSILIEGFNKNNNNIHDNLEVKNDRI